MLPPAPLGHRESVISAEPASCSIPGKAADGRKRQGLEWSPDCSCLALLLAATQPGQGDSLPQQLSTGGREEVLLQFLPLCGSAPAGWSGKED